QIIPPSIALVLLGDVLASAYQQAQLQLGVVNLQTLSVGDLFVGAVIPGLLLVMLYMLYVLFVATTRPRVAPAAIIDTEGTPGAKLLLSLLPVLALITLVLGSILTGI